MKRGCAASGWSQRYRPLPEVATHTRCALSINKSRTNGVTSVWLSGTASKRPSRKRTTPLLVPIQSEPGASSRNTVAARPEGQPSAAVNERKLSPLRSRTAGRNPTSRATQSIQMLPRESSNTRSTSSQAKPAPRWYQRFSRACDSSSDVVAAKRSTPAPGNHHSPSRACRQSKLVPAAAEAEGMAPVGDVSLLEAAVPEDAQVPFVLPTGHYAQTAGAVFENGRDAGRAQAVSAGVRDKSAVFDVRYTLAGGRDPQPAGAVLGQVEHIRRQPVVCTDAPDDARVAGGIQAELDNRVEGGSPQAAIATQNHSAW